MLCHVLVDAGRQRDIKGDTHKGYLRQTDSLASKTVAQGCKTDINKKHRKHSSLCSLHRPENVYLYNYAKNRPGRVMLHMPFIFNLSVYFFRGCLFDFE